MFVQKQKEHMQIPHFLRDDTRMVGAETPEYRCGTTVMTGA